MTLRQRLGAWLGTRFDEARRGDDRGAALVLALIFVTVVVVVMAAVLAYADTNIRATVALRRQAAAAATAEAAAEVAINTLRKAGYNGSSGQCFGASAAANTLTLDNFRPNTAGAADSAAVTCERDTATSQLPSTGTPSGYALRALQANSGAETAVDVKVTGSGSGVNVAGDVGSAGSIVMDHGALNVTGSVHAKSCSGTINATVTKTCGAAAPNVTDPLYALPPAPLGPGNVTACATKRTFSPGVYSTLSTLTDAWSSCGAATVFDFRPGVYYFAFSGLWEINRGTMVAGSRNVLTNTPPAIPGACPNPLTSSTPGAGVQFVFGAEARMLLTGDAKVEICGQTPTVTGEPPIALYGLRSPLGSGSLLVPAQSGCITRFAGSGTKCAVIQTDNHSSGLAFYVQGHAYQPNAKVDLDLRGSSDQFFSGGMTVRSLAIFSPASSTLPTPLSSGPIQVPAAGRTIVLLTVYVCPAQATCTTGTGKIRLRVKAGLADPSGTTTPGPRSVTVYSWSVQR